MIRNHPTNIIWRKSSYSGAGGEQSDCVEAAELGGVVGIRDSKNLGGAVLRLTPAAWTALLDAARNH